MSDSSALNTQEMLLWVAELRAGRVAASGPAVRKIMTRVERIARVMTRKFPRVGRFADADDVVQGAMIRLLRALWEVRPGSTREFYALTAEMIRRELLDLAKHFYGPRGAGTHLAEVEVGADGHDPAAPDDHDDPDLDRMAAFHEAVAGLPAAEREVVGLAYYHGWTQTQIADLFGVSVRTVQRWQWAAAARLRGAVPPG